MSYKKSKNDSALEKKDSRDIYYELLRGGGEWEEIISQLPEEYKLNYDPVWLYNQAKSSMCVFFASTGLYNKLFNKKFSPTYLSYFGKKISNLGYGAYTVDGPKALKAFSTCEFDLLPDSVCSKDSDYSKLKITKEMQQNAAKYKTVGYCRTDSMFGNSFDNIKLFIKETKSPCIITIPYYTTFNGTPDGGEYVKTKYSKYVTGHVALCIGWTKDKYILVDSFLRVVTMSKNIMVGESFGLLDFHKEKIKIPKKPAKRDLELERRNAEALKAIIYDRFIKTDKARVTSYKYWFELIHAVTYNGFTLIDLVNWIYKKDRTGEDLFDLSKNRKEISFK